MSVGEHFERVAAVYESLRTTDEAPVRKISRSCCLTARSPAWHWLRDGPVLAAAARAAAGRLAAGRQRRVGGHGGTAQGRQPRPRRWGGAAASSRRTAAVTGRQPRCGHRVQLRSPLRPRPLPDRRRPGAGAGGQLFIYTRTPQQNARTGLALPGLHRTRAAAAQPGRDPGRRQANRRAHGGHNTNLQPLRARARPGGSRPRPRAATTRRSPSTPRRSCAPRSRRSWAACPAPRSAGWTSTC